MPAATHLVAAPSATTAGGRAGASSMRHNAVQILKVTMGETL